MNISIITGSQHADSQSAKVADYCSKQLSNLGIQASIIDLGKNHLPYYDEQHNPESDLGITMWKPYHDMLSASDGIIIISPERGGMVPGMLKNFFLWCDDNELAHKPGLLIGVSSGMGGSYPIAELRMSSYKNTKICYMPDHVIVRNVEKVLNTEQTEESQRIEKRINTSLETLVAYMKGFALIRQEGIIQANPMPYGM